MAKVFISYSHRDEDIKDQMVEHFTNLVRDNTVTLWHDRHLLAGEEFTPEIEKQILNSDIILLLVSSKFLNSDYCRNQELPLALGLRKQGKATVIPIKVSFCDWEETEFRHLNFLPTDGRPIKNFGNRDEAFTEITKKVRQRAKIINNSPNSLYQASSKVSNRISPYTSTLFWFFSALISLLRAAIGFSQWIISLFINLFTDKKTKKTDYSPLIFIVILIFLVKSFTNPIPSEFESVDLYSEEAIQTEVRFGSIDDTASPPYAEAATNDESYILEIEGQEKGYIKTSTPLNEEQLEWCNGFIERNKPLTSTDFHNKLNCFTRFIWKSPQ